MKALRAVSQFRRNLKRIKKRGYDLDKLDEVITLLREGDDLPREYHDHALKGDWVGSRDCHIETDWILIYETDDDEVVLQATGTHADLFE